MTRMSSRASQQRCVRQSLLRLVRAARLLACLLPMPELPAHEAPWTDRHDPTHRVDVRDQLDAKLSSLRAHGSQAGGGPRTLCLLLRLPRPLRARVLRYEYFRATHPDSSAADVP